MNRERTINFDKNDDNYRKVKKSNLIKRKKDHLNQKKVRFSDKPKVIEKFDLNELSNKIKNIKEDLTSETNSSSEENNKKSFFESESSSVKNDKFSLIRFILKLILFIIFIIIIYISYNIIFKKVSFSEALQNIRSIIKSKDKNETIIGSPAPSTNLNLNINSSPSSVIPLNNLTKTGLESPSTEITSFSPSFKGGQTYIDEKNLVNDIISILDQFK